MIEKGQTKAPRMTKTKFALWSFVLIIGTFVSCSITDQITQAKQLSRCDFVIMGVQEVHLAGIPLNEGMKRNDLNAGQMIQLAAAIFSVNMPLDFDILLKATNPNDKDAALNKLDYQVLLDDNQLISGSITERIFIPAHDTIIIKIPVNAELFEVLSGKSGDAVVNLGFRLSGQKSNKGIIEIKIKPSIKVGLKDISYPGFISLKKEI